MLTLSRSGLLASGAALALARPARAAAGPELEVWKMRACGCCKGWGEHFEAAGFATKVHEVDDVGAARAAAGVPADLGGCHTSKVAGYVVEGHVPVPAVQRLLRERPAILGLAVPGMPLVVRGRQKVPIQMGAAGARPTLSQASVTMPTICVALLAHPGRRVARRE